LLLLLSLWQKSFLLFHIFCHFKRLDLKTLIWHSSLSAHHLTKATALWLKKFRERLNTHTHTHTHTLTGSISPTLYEQLLQTKIPKAQKDTDEVTVFFLLKGSLGIKAARKHVGEIDSGRKFHQPYMRAFFVRIFQQSQNVTRKTTFVQKIRTYNVDEIEIWSLKIFL